VDGGVRGISLGELSVGGTEQRGKQRGSERRYLRARNRVYVIWLKIKTFGYYRRTGERKVKGGVAC